MSRFKPMHPGPSLHQFRQLEPSHPRFQLLIEQNIDGMVILGSDRSIRFVNPAAEAHIWKNLGGSRGIGVWLSIFGRRHHRN